MKRIIAILACATMLLSFSACVETAHTGGTVESQTTSEEQQVEQVMLEQDGIKVVYKGLNTGGFFGPTMKVYIENNTDKNIIVQVNEFSVNDFMVNPLFSQDVAANKKANGEISILQSYLDENSITKIETIELTFVIIDDDFNTLLESGLIKITL